MLNVSISRTIDRIKMSKKYLRLKQLLLTVEWEFSRLLYYRNVKEKKNIEKKHISDNAGIPNMGMQAYLSGPSYRPNGLLNNHGNRVTVTQRFWTSSLHSAFNFLGGCSQPVKDGPLHFMFVYLRMYSSFRGENAEESRFFHLCSISWITGQGRS